VLTRGIWTDGSSGYQLTLTVKPVLGSASRHVLLLMMMMMLLSGQKTLWFLHVEYGPTVRPSTNLPTCKTCAGGQPHVLSIFLSRDADSGKTVYLTSFLLMCFLTSVLNKD
jgi:hypothetical protein